MHEMKFTEEEIEILESALQTLEWNKATMISDHLSKDPDAKRIMERQKKKLACIREMQKRIEKIRRNGNGAQ